MPISPHAVGDESVRTELEAILASETFSRSQQLSRLLKYLCDALLAHDAERIAEYTIGTEALGRPSDFDPTQDAAVRVEMHRLRRRLRDYYSGEGAHHTIRIDIPAGRYAPVVTRVGDEPKGSAVAPAETDPNQVAVDERPKTRWVHLRPVVWISIAAAIVMVSMAARLPWHRPESAIVAVRADTPKSSPVIPGSSPHAGLRIGCGRRSTWTDRLGQIWGADQYFQGGDAINLPERSYIAGIFDAHLFQSARSGTFAYRIPLAEGTYEMHLYFVEPVFGPDNDHGGEANRLFKIAINGKEVLDRFDIVADADGPWTADVRVFKDILPGADGLVRLDFQSISEQALINAIEFVPARPHILNPVRLLPQDNFYTDSAGNLWTPDNYSRGGRVAIHPGPIKNTRDQEIFRHERFGRFRYAIPVDRGAYSVYLYMSEEYWGPGNPGGGDAGSRVFSVFCNGVALLRSFDLYKESGTNRGVVRGFHHLTPNGQGKLLLSFEPEHDYASIYALEVIDEGGPDVPSWQKTLSGGASN